MITVSHSRGTMGKRSALVAPALRLFAYRCITPNAFQAMRIGVVVLPQMHFHVRRTSAESKPQLCHFRMLQCQKS